MNDGATAPHTLRYTMGANATLSGEAVALTGAILRHANTRSAVIYALAEMDHSNVATDRVRDQLATAQSKPIAVPSTIGRD